MIKNKLIQLIEAESTIPKSIMITIILIYNREFDFYKRRDEFDYLLNYFNRQIDLSKEGLIIVKYICITMLSDNPYQIGEAIEEI